MLSGSGWNPSRGGFHPVDHPVLAAGQVAGLPAALAAGRPAGLPVGREQDVAALRPGSVQHDLDLGITPLLQLVVTAIPDADVAATVLARLDVTLEAAVLDRVIFGVHGKVIRLGVLRDALRQRPGDQDAVVLKPEIPVQGTRMVLLDDEGRPTPALSLPRAPGAHRLGSPGRIALGPVGTERGIVVTRWFRGHSRFRDAGRLRGTSASRRRHARHIPGSSLATRGLCLSIRSHSVRSTCPLGNPAARCPGQAASRFATSSPAGAMSTSASNASGG